VKPNFEKYVEPQRKVAGMSSCTQVTSVECLLMFKDIIVPRGVENRVAICKYFLNRF
jgi:hypothetical protein